MTKPIINFSFFFSVCYILPGLRADPVWLNPAVFVGDDRMAIISINTAGLTGWVQALNPAG